jgi:hypothetical protein
MLHVWILADDVNDFNFKLTMNRKWPSECAYILDHLRVEYSTLPLKQLMDKTGTPDFILIDCSSISLLNDQDIGYSVLEKFAQNHSSSILVITSMCHPLAKQTLTELKTYIEKDAVAEDLGGGPECAAAYLRKKVLEYYPNE